MHRTPPLRALLAAAIVMAWSSLAHASPPAPEASAPKLACEVGSDLLPFAGVDGEMLLVAGADGPVPAPASARWTLLGDLRSHAPLLLGAPRYRLERDPRHDNGQHRAYVRVDHLIDVASPRSAIKDFSLRRWAETLPEHKDPFAHYWTADPTRPGVVVAAWLMSGRAVHVMAQPLPQVGPTREFSLTFDFSLTADEIAGKPVLLLWQDGAWVPARPFSEHGPTQTALHAILFDDDAALAAALAAGARPGAKGGLDGISLVHFAASFGTPAALERLIAERPRAALEASDAGHLPLQNAASDGRPENFALLLGRITRARDQASIVSDALVRAIAYGHSACVSRALAWIRVHLQEARLDRELGELPWKAGFVDLCAMLGQDTPIAAGEGAVQPGPAEQAALLSRLLVEHASAGHRSIVRHLLATTPTKPNSQWKGVTALTAAATSGNVAMARDLLDAGADPNLAIASGNTPLIAAAQADLADLVALLIEHGAKPGATNEEGMSALHFAAQNDAAPIVSMLLDAGADLQICSIRDMTPLDLALFTGATASAELLIQRGACIGLGAPYSRDLIFAAISQDLASPVATAIEQGWPATSTFAGTWPALRVAELFGASRCAEILRAAGAISEPERPARVVAAAALDTPLQVVAAPVIVDPRRPGQAFPAARVGVRVLVDPQGRPLFPTTQDRTDPHVRLAALKAAQQARFTPPRSGGRPAAVFTMLAIDLPGSRDRVFVPELADDPPPLTYLLRPQQPASVRPARDSRVVVNYVINTLGHVEQLEIVESCAPACSDSVRLAMSQWSFKPLKHQGMPIAVRMTHTFTFDTSR